VLIVNADLPCVRPRDLLALLGAAPLGGMALVEAADGTTNALALADPVQFQDLYGPGSAARFRAYARSHGLGCVTIAIPNLAADVDTLDDLDRLRGRLGPHTAAALASFKEAATA
jgi:2-phospho-L-lactate guanylyltransferase